MMEELQIRLATADDQSSIVALIDSVYREYGDEVCLDGAEQDLLSIDETYFKRGGAFWVLVDDASNVLGTHGAVPAPPDSGSSDHDPKCCNFRRLYLHQSLRGTDWGHTLMQLTIDWARDRDFDRVEFWSDTRFKRAHRFFEKFNFQLIGDIRTMHDGVTPYQEYFFVLKLK